MSKRSNRVDTYINKNKRKDYCLIPESMPQYCRKTIPTKGKVKCAPKVVANPLQNYFAQKKVNPKSWTTNF
ncbi:hypothetical protein SJDPG2_01665 [Porphyromonas gingivalis SJD2]|nr:hypothetical protein SJDPG2_01665 [Porphyromonas gingivalis SJD2]